MLKYEVQNLINYLQSDMKYHEYEMHICDEFYQLIKFQLDRPLHDLTFHPERFTITFAGCKLTIIKNNVFADKLNNEQGDRILGALFINEIQCVEYFYYFKVSSNENVYLYQAVSKLEVKNNLVQS